MLGLFNMFIKKYLRIKFIYLLVLSMYDLTLNYKSKQVALNIWCSENLIIMNST